MNRIFATVAVLFVLVGCASSFPEMPDVETEKGRNCVRRCQEEHSFCISSCESVVTGIADDSSQCVAQCNRKLEECYRVCAEEDKGT